ncbi:hypothetical protein D9615_009605 [Tricholomella constricta]|uniref:Nucleolar pre-ribosomal-associated protein 1 n=1 Tax=Tricholomella constricta TaxID=117010 RepID=A0A8H5GV48_9AGAR|nr:hypothetical protein D9615_009605 [Tricholomella constricta]
MPAASSTTPRLVAGRKTTNQARVFTSVEHISAALHTQNQQLLVENLTALRNQLSIRPGEDTVPPQDERLLLAQHWLENVPGAHDIFRIWDSITQRQSPVFSLLVSVLSSLLALTSSHYTFQPLGQPILKTLLTPTYMRRLNSYVAGTNAELILVTLKLFNTMSAFAGGREKKAVLDSFGWEIKSLPKLLNMRRKTKTEDPSDALAKPDIRTLYILFILSFTGSDTPIQVKTTFFEQHRDPFLAIFKGLNQDAYPVLRRVLEVCWAGIWSDPKVKRTLKIGLFSEATISHLVKLYDRDGGDDPDQVPADLVHHFLLALCTRPGTGICFRDRGWYPRESESDAAEPKDKDAAAAGWGKIYNKILANVLKSLKVNEDLRQQELALKIMRACPELVSGYWAGAALTLEPRLSSKWIANIAFFGSVISIPVPTSSFHLPSTTTTTTLYNPTPPPLSTILENIFPSSVNTKAHFSKGLQSPSGLVQHCTAIALAKCLAKYEEVLAVFRGIEGALGEDEAEGQWCKRRRDVEREARRRVPDFQVVVAFSQLKFAMGEKAAGEKKPLNNPTRAALLAESAQRLLWMYHCCLQGVVKEARFDVGKLLLGAEAEEKAEKDDSDSATRLRVVRQLHVLRLLKDSDQFVWSGKMGSTSQSYLAVLLKAYTTSQIPAIRTALAQLLQHILAQSILFQEDPTEPYLWLLSLPTSTSARGPRGTEAPDGARLTNEGESVITFLDDCVQRCLKTPYRYIEELHALSEADGSSSSSADNFHVDVLPSPLLMTLLEQLQIKINKKALSASDVLALATFLRKLVYRLKSKMQEVRVLRKVADRVDAVLGVECLFSEFGVVTAAIRREVELMRACLVPHRRLLYTEVEEVSEDVKEFLSAVEHMPIPTDKATRRSTASEFIDWLRLVDENDPLGAEEIRRVSGVLMKLDPPALELVAEHVPPGDGALWRGLDLVTRFPEVREYLHFDFLFLHASEAEIVDEKCREILVETALRQDSNIAETRRAVVLISHRLFGETDAQARGLLFLLAAILRRAEDILSPADVAALKEFVFMRSRAIKAFLRDGALSEVVREGVHYLVESSLDPVKESDKALVADTSAFWLEALNSSFSGVPIQKSRVSVWIKYFQPEDLFNVLDALLKNLTPPTPSTSDLDLLGDVFTALRTLTASHADSEVELMRRLPQLIALRSLLPNSLVLEELIAIAIESSIPAYCNGAPSSCGNGKAVEETRLGGIVRRAELRRSRHMNPRLVNLDLPAQSFLEQDSWTQATVTIVAGLIYQTSSSFPRKEFVRWLGTDHCARTDPGHFVTVVHAFLDTSFCRGQGLSSVNDSDIWLPQFTRLVEALSDDGLPHDTRSTAVTCLSLMIRLIPSRTAEFLSAVVHAVQALPVDKLNPYLLFLGRQLQATAESLVAELVDHGIQWAVRFFAEPEDASFDPAIGELTSLVQISPAIKPHLVETLLGVVIQNRLAHPLAVKLITALLSNVHLKPVVVNRHLQSILQHPNFFKLCASATPDGRTRDAIVQLLHVLFYLHPTNTCQVTHVEPLVHIYRGTLSPADGQILSIFQLFETERKVSIASLLSQWSSDPNVPSANSLEAVQSLDAILVLRTCLNFPRWRSLEELRTDKATSQEAQLYDPVFLMLLCAQTLAENPPESAFAWVELFRTNVVSLLIKALSSKDGAIRDIAMCQIAALWQYLESADIQERPHLLHILSLLKDVLPSPADEAPRRLPSYTTLLLLHALRGIFYPSNFIYPITARFLLQRPELDTNDVPMLYNMLYSSSDDWKKERGWIIRFLSDGMMSTEDWRILKSRHTWDLLASLFQSSEDDRALRAGILEVLANLTCNNQATTSLVLKSGLLSWIEIQLVASKDTVNGIEWVKILENVMAIANPEKLESSTNGAWRAAICRCLILLLDSSRSSNISATLPLVIQATLRLSLLPGPQVPELPCLLGLCVESLKHLEASTTVPPTSIGTSPSSPLPSGPLYKAHEIHESLHCENPVQIWGAAVEALWRVSMSLEAVTGDWDLMTSRMLVWRALIGPGHDAAAMSEWARREVVRNMAA